jgi:hypothetical protein
MRGGRAEEPGGGGEDTGGSGDVARGGTVWVVEDGGIKAGMGVEEVRVVVGGGGAEVEGERAR